ncbi:MAG TPA: sulfite exporter TauE/SafE family protein [Paracoccaceae bacterium]|nr:sulfite exporter TauE/SafE family protein [Paracoccaceae bacterium]
MELDLTFFLFAVPAVLFAGISKGGFAAGPAFAASPFLALVIEPQLAVGVMLPLLIVADVAAMRGFWRQWNWKNARALMIGAVPGIILGALLFKYMNADFLRLLIGAISIGFVLFQGARKYGLIHKTERPFNAAKAMFWGGVAGFTSFVSHAGGPPASVHLLSQRLSKTEYQATTVLTFWCINLVKVIPYAMIGMFTRETLVANVYLAPVAFIGAFIGIYLHRVISERLFFTLAYVFLLMTGAKLIFDALT